MSRGTGFNMLAVLQLLLMVVLAQQKISIPLSPNDDFPFQLTYSPLEITSTVTSDVTLRCERDPNTTSALVDISWMRILKEDGDTWKVLAEIWRDEDAQVQTENAQISGSGMIEHADTAFLEIKWDVAIPDTFGVYKCDAVGIDETSLSQVEFTSEVAIKETDVTAKSLLSFLERVIDEIIHKTTLASWPSGDYALLKPDSGCPVDLAYLGQGTSYIRFSSDQSILPSNIMSAVREGRYSDESIYFFDLRFCESNKRFNTVPWPKGSFCVHKKQTVDCPNGFREGTLEISKFPTDSWSHSGKLYFDDYFGNVYLSNDKLQFCCRDDSTAYEPVLLPKGAPFYLYRFGGSCQIVHGMKTDRSFLPIRVKRDSTSSFSPDTTDYGSYFAGIELCYYTPTE